MPDLWADLTWRQGTRYRLRSRFAALRIWPAQRDSRDKNPFAEQSLLVEWPSGESEPTKYWLSNLAANVSLQELIHLAKHRWIVECDYEELKQELGLGHYEGRNWHGFHHHATLCIAAYGFFVAARSRFPPPPPERLCCYVHRGYLPGSGHAARRYRSERTAFGTCYFRVRCEGSENARSSSETARVLTLNEPTHRSSLFHKEVFHES